MTPVRLQEYQQSVRRASIVKWKLTVSGHPRDAKKVFITGAGRLRESKNTEFVWELRKTGFCEGGLL